MNTLMNADEVAATVYCEQGFIVMTTYSERVTIGSIHRGDYYGELETSTPLRCIGPSTHEEFARQVNRMNQLDGANMAANHVPGAKYYRMEPCD